MSTWIRRPTDAPSRLGGMLGDHPDAGRSVPGAWHLEAIIPATSEHIFTACGLGWASSQPGAIERTKDPSQLRECVRCATCDAIYVRRIITQ